jgi:hypothetical protein
MATKLFNILSPDGISISMENFSTKEEALIFFSEWKKRFEQQGYYSSNHGRIPLTELEDECCFVQI